MLCLQLVISRVTNGRTDCVARNLAKMANSLATAARLLSMIETRGPACTWMDRLRNQMAAGGGRPATASLREIGRIGDWSAARQSRELHTLLNWVFLWDVQCAISAESWRRRYGGSLRAWLDALGDVEALSSLSTVHFDHPDWIFPEVTEDRLCFEAKALGHPLLLDTTRVCNNISMMAPASITIITGR